MAVDKHTIEGCKKRDQAAQRKLYNQCVGRVYFAIKRYVSDEHYIENVIQDTFLKALTNIDRYDASRAKFETWISAIAVRESINHLRRKKFEFSPVETTPIHSTDKNLALENMQAEALLKELDKLPATHRAIFCLYEIEGYSHREIGTMLNVTESTSRSYLTRAKSLFRKNLSQLDYV